MDCRKAMVLCLQVLNQIFEVSWILDWVDWETFRSPLWFAEHSDAQSSTAEQNIDPNGEARRSGYWWK